MHRREDQRRQLDAAPRCVECGQRVDPGLRSVVREVTGWVEHRSGGGVHHLLFRQETGRLMHTSCAAVKQTTGNALQGSLL